MSSFKDQMISCFRVILSAILGSFLILGGADYAQANSAMVSTLTSGVQIALTPMPKAGNIQTLAPNTAYRVDRTSDPNRACPGQTAQVKFTFTSDEFRNGKFEEIYPIQDNWDLFFHTSEELNGDEQFSFEELSDCGLVAQEDSLELLSGFKTKTEADASETEAHFVVGKDYYAFDPEKPVGQQYDLLGSLTAIGGTEFPALKGAAIGQLIIKPDSIRAPHWHLKYNETGYCHAGLGQVGIIVPGNTLPKGGDEEGFFKGKRIEEFFLKPGEIFHFPEATQHYLRNVGDEPFECTLFFAEGQAISEDSLLTITLANIVGNTPLGVLGPILVTDRDPSTASGTPPMYNAKQISQTPAQSYSSVNQGPEIVKVVEACHGVLPDVNDPGCPARSDRMSQQRQAKRKGVRLRRSIYSTLEP